MTSHTPVTRIGAIEAEAGVRVVDPQGHAIERTFGSFDHFA
jgi:thiamine-monophosphate kinase